MIYIKLSQTIVLQDAVGQTPAETGIVDLFLPIKELGSIAQYPDGLVTVGTNDGSKYDINQTVDDLFALVKKAGETPDTYALVIVEL